MWSRLFNIVKGLLHFGNGRLNFFLKRLETPSILTKREM
jgi:hypothetical protein